MIGSQAKVFWIFGLSGAGKSTLARKAAHHLRKEGMTLLTLDGDQVRTGLSAGLDYSESGRAENLRRAAEVAKLAVESGITVIATFITPRDAHRDLVRHILGTRVCFIYLNASLAVCRLRDTKGLYAKAEQGDIALMTGVSSAFEEPADADLVLDTGSRSESACEQELRAFVSMQSSTARSPGKGTADFRT